MEKWFALFEVEHFGYLLFAAVLQQVVKQSWLFFLDQLGHSNGSSDIRQRIVGGLVSQAIGSGEIFEFKTWTAGLMVWPLYALGSQRSG